MYKKIISAIIFFIGCATFVVISPSVLAEYNISVSPPILELSLKKGESIKKTIKIFNLSKKEIPIQIDVVDFYYDENEKLQIITAEEINDPELKKFSMKNWINVKDNIKLKSKETKEIEVEFKVPKDAIPGGHYGMLLVKEGSSSSLTGNAVGISGKIGIMTLITVPGKFNLKGGITEGLKTGKLSDDKDKKFNSKKIFTEGPIDFKFKFQNKAATHIKPSGNITVKNILGIKVGEVKLEEKRIFPGSTRSFYETLNKEFIFGPYFASLDVTDPTGQHYYSSAFFLGLPLKLTLILLAILTAIIIFIKINNRRTIEKALRAAGIDPESRKKIYKPSYLKKLTNKIIQLYGVFSKKYHKKDKEKNLGKDSIEDKK